MNLFENEQLIVVIKSAGVLTTPARSADDPRPCLGRELQARLGQQIYPVHRLDFEVSGLVMFAKSTDAHRAAQGWFERGLIEKHYQAFSATMIYEPNDWVEWRSHLVRGKRRSFEAPHGKLAKTRARATASGRWDLQPLTGRPHQLRVEMAKHGIPIAGDVLYGGVQSVRPGIALRAVALDFRHVSERFGLPEHLSAGDLVWDFGDAP